MESCSPEAREQKRGGASVHKGRSQCSVGGAIVWRGGASRKCRAG